MSTELFGFVMGIVTIAVLTIPFYIAMTRISKK